MRIFLVQAAGDLTGAAGYGRALLDSGNRLVLVTYADQALARRPTILPPEDHPAWNQVYDAPIPSQPTED